MAATFCEVWSAVATLVAELDVLSGFADLATSDPTRPYCKPEMLELDEGTIELKVCVCVFVRCVWSSVQLFAALLFSQEWCWHGPGGVTR